MVATTQPTEQRDRQRRALEPLETEVVVADEPWPALDELERLFGVDDGWSKPTGRAG